jgi:RimJ/RimL family protein N-acetyltransferase
VELQPYGEDDFALTEALECDPAVMRELGGPVPRAELAVAHRRRVEDEWYFTIVPEPGAPAAGQIGIWESGLPGAVHEVGWILLPAFHGRGLASAALRLLIERAREEPRFTRIHAFPGVANAPSNALCSKFGFELTGERDLQFRGRPLRCNHWELDVRPAPRGDAGASPGS